MNDRECNRNASWIKEAIWIRKTTLVMNPDKGVYIESRMERPACQDNWRAEVELAVPEFLMKAADGSRNVE